MSISRFFVRSVSILRAPLVEDRSGTEIRDWDNAVSTPAPRGWLAQRSASELRETREAQLSTWVLSLPAGIDVLGTDRVLVDSVPYEINGEINRPWTPSGEHHVVVPLDRVVG